MTGVPQPREMLWELMSPNNNKAAKLRLRLVRKYGPASYLCGIAWMAASTRRWIYITLVSSVLSWILMLLTVLLAVMTAEKSLSTYTHGLLTSVFTIMYFLGYLGFSQNSLLLGAVYCMAQIAIVVFEYTEVFVIINREFKTVHSSGFYAAVTLGALAGATDFILFVCTAVLLIRIRTEDQECLLLLPIERLEEVGNDVLFLRWYHSIPLGPPVQLRLASASRLGNRRTTRAVPERQSAPVVTQSQIAPAPSAPAPSAPAPSALPDLTHRSDDKRPRRSHQRHRRLRQLSECSK